MKYVCSVCGFVYDDELEGVPFDKLPHDWFCPVCHAKKSAFNKEKTQEEIMVNSPPSQKQQSSFLDDVPDLELSTGALARVCSNLALGCQKQYLPVQQQKFEILAKYFDEHTSLPNDIKEEQLIELITKNLEDDYSNLTDVAKANNDRGALRVKVWGEKVTNMLDSLWQRYISEGEKMLENTRVWVCTICGFVFVGDNPPSICPVCKVQSNKFVEVKGDEQ